MKFKALPSDRIAHGTGHKRFVWWRRVLVTIPAVCMLSFGATVAAQCVSDPKGEASVGVKNASNYFLTFYIDGVNAGGVPIGDRSINFAVAPGEHVLVAEARIRGELVSASRLVVVPSGAVCTWTVTDPVPPRSTAIPGLRDGMSWHAVVSIVIPN